MSDDLLKELLFPRKRKSKSKKELDFAYIHKELRRKGVTLQLLWAEYKRDNEDGYQYSQYCNLYREWRSKIDTSMRQVHKAGEKLFVDYAGQTVPIVDRNSGEARPAYIFVAVMGASNYTYAEASLSMDLPSWIAAHCRALAFLGGVPSLIVPDNPKTAVLKANFYEPQLNPTYQDMANHYGTIILPTRPRKPRDKAKAETGVLISERWLLAPLRNRTFFSVIELNRALLEQLKEMNLKPFQKLEGCRKDLFEALDKPALKPLPTTSYEFARWKKARVSIDCHIQVDLNFYSVPYQLVRKEVDVRITNSTLEVFLKGERICSHPLADGKGRYVSDSNHFSPSHRQYLEWTPQRLIDWAFGIGEHTCQLVRVIMESKTHPEQGYRACLGIMRLSKKYPDRIETACKRALSSGACSYRSVAAILEKGLDQVPFEHLLQNEESSPPKHANIRGPKYYNDAKEDPSC